MEFVILGVANAVLLILFLAALKLIRGDRDIREDRADRPEGRDRAEPVEDGAIDLRDSAVEPVAVERRSADGPKGGSSLADEAEAVADRPRADSTDPDSTDRAGRGSIDLPTSLRTFGRSAIIVESSLNGAGPTPEQLLFSVIEALGEVGLLATSDSATSGRLRDAQGHSATIELTKSLRMTDRIVISVDSERAVEALAVLEVWHRSRLGSTDRVRLSARIR